MSAALAPAVEVLAVQYPGRQDRRHERPVESIDELAEQVFAALPEPGEAPVSFFGHSMGAVVAYEVARLMETRLGRGPRHLFASGRRAPSTYREGLVHLDDDEALVAELVQMGGTKHAFLHDRELRATILPVVRGDYRAIERYEHAPGPPIGCPVTVLVGDSDPRTTIDEAAAWRGHCAGDFELRVFTGGHFYLDTHWPDVVTMVSDTLTAPAGAGGAR